MPTLLASDVVIEEEKPTVRAITPAPTAEFGVVGISQRGPIGSSVEVTSFAEYQKIFGDDIANSDAGLAVRGFFDNGGAVLHFARTVHFSNPADPTSKTSAQASLQLQTANAAPTSGSETSTNTAPFGLHAGETLVVGVDGNAAVAFTFNATAGARTAANAGPYALVNNQTLIFSIDGVSQTVTWLTAEFVAIGAATATEVCNVLNQYFLTNSVGALADVSGGAVRITSLRKGTGSSVNVTGGTSAGAFAFPGGANNGTGNVSNIAAVTTAEVLAIVTPVGATVSAVGGAIKITSNTTGGASSVQVTGASTAAAEFGFDAAIHTGGAGGTQNTLQVKGKTDGSYGNGVSVVVAAPTNGDAAHFNLTVLYNGATVESWPNLSMSALAADYALTVVNDPNTGSDYIVLVDDASSLPSPQNLPNTGTFGPLTGGNDGLVGLADADFIGGSGANGDTGLRVLDAVQTIGLLAVPGRATASVHNAMITYAEITRNGQLFCILDPPANQSATQIVNYVKNTAQIQRLSEYAAIYWPRILIDNPSKTVFGNTQTIVAPPSGAIAGMYSRLDQQTRPVGVFQHPAGTENGILFGVRGLEMPEVKKKPKREIVFPELINPISTEPGQPIFVDGARTLKDNGNWPTIGERRGVIFVETSLRQGLAFARHRNLADRLYNEMLRTTRAFLLQLCRNEAFATTDPTLAFAIDTGKGLNTPSVKQARQAIERVSLATAKPGEFIVVKVAPDTRELDAELAAAQAA